MSSRFFCPLLCGKKISNLNAHSKVCVNKEGYVVASITGNTYESIVMVFKPNGDLIFSNYLHNYVIDIDISQDSKYLAIAEIDNSNIMPITEVQMVSIDKALKNAEDAIVNSYQTENNELLTGIKFQGKNKFW